MHRIWHVWRSSQLNIGGFGGDEERHFVVHQAVRTDETELFDETMETTRNIS